MTQRIRTWVSEQCHQRNLLRETAAQANYLLDLYISRGGHVQVNTLQLVSMGCLRLSSKINQGYGPSNGV